MTAIVDGLNSRDPQRVADALHQMRRSLPPRQQQPAPTPDLLNAFPDGPSSEVAIDYIWVLAHYQPFVPPLAPADRVRYWMEAVLRSGDGGAALQVAMYLGPTALAAGADVAAALAYVADRGVRPGREAQGAEYMARYLLDRSETYDRAVAGLRAWQDEPVLGEVLQAVTAYVEPADRPHLGL